MLTKIIITMKSTKTHRSSLPTDILSVSHIVFPNSHSHLMLYCEIKFSGASSPRHEKYSIASSRYEVPEELIGVENLDSITLRWGVDWLIDCLGDFVSLTQSTNQCMIARLCNQSINCRPSCWRLVRFSFSPFFQLAQHQCLPPTRRVEFLCIQKATSWTIAAETDSAERGRHGAAGRVTGHYG